MSTFIPPVKFSTPILFLIFNRPDTTRIAFESIRYAKPPRLYIAADGPRLQVLSDKMKCDEARSIVEKIDWACEVHTLFRSTNLGCGRAISSAITWFFNQEKEGVILEDDCLPSKSFFWYCQELLERYRDDTRIMHIGGNNFINGWHGSTDASYYFSTNGHIWGWATWASAWKAYDFKMAKFNSLNQLDHLNDFFLNPLEKYYRIRKFKQVLSSRIDTWDYQWDFARFINSGLAIVPKKNLVSNIGYGSGATHTKESSDPWANVAADEITLPLKHPQYVQRDRYMDKRYFSLFFTDRIFSKLKLTSKM